MEFKIIFPAGHQNENQLSTNVDVDIILENGDVYVASVFTLINIDDLMERNNSMGFWASDMLIVRDLKKATIRAAIAEAISENYVAMAFDKIGTLQTKFPGYTFDDLPDMATGFELDINWDDL
jgi:hypothetical protein